MIFPLLLSALTLETPLQQLQPKPLPFCLLNAQLQSGYITMPSAHMAESGTIGIGYAYLPPYQLINASLQLFSAVELTANYWLYMDLPEPAFGKQGFGNDAERAANFKIALHPNLAIGCNDILGTQRMRSIYTVASHRLGPVEGSFGWGSGRIQGPFGALAWHPFPYLHFMVEYDGNQYTSHPHEHPDGRSTRSPINAGVQLALGPHTRLSITTLRGTNWSAAISGTYPLGTSPGLLPKSAHPPPIRDKEPLGLERSRLEFAHELAYQLKARGFITQTLSLIPNQTDTLRIDLENLSHKTLSDVRTHLAQVLGAFVPHNIDTITAVLHTRDLPLQEYRFRSSDLHNYRTGAIGAAEFSVLTPVREAEPPPDPHNQVLLYAKSLPRFEYHVRPRFNTYLGSRTGKFKYAAAISAGADGYLPLNLYYRIIGSYCLHSNAHDVPAQDFHNPSRLPQVRTDAILYQQATSIHLEEAYLQRSWNLGHGWLGRVAGGYFELPFGGLAVETLYAPVRNSWAMGFEAAILAKRTYQGLGFTSQLRQFDGREIHATFLLPIQWFFDLYGNIAPLNIDYKLSLGQFLAGDRGLRIDLTRTFQSGLKIGFWSTLTNGGDTIGNRPYYDKGIAIGMPLDFFLPHPSTRYIGTAMSAWLRDVGARSSTGTSLQSHRTPSTL